MKILLIDNNAERSFEFSIGDQMRRALIAALCIAPLLFSIVGYSIAHFSIPSAKHPQVVELRAALEEQKKLFDALKNQSQLENDAMSVRLAQLQARIMRLDALGERVAEAAEFDKEEFNFDTLPAVGGFDNFASPYATDTEALTPLLIDVERQVEDREQQLAVISELLKDRDISEQTRVQGWPIDSGWMSSRYGRRTDPFSGKPAVHKGVDFASKLGDPVRSVAAGVVTWAGYRTGYGLTVEVNHGAGYMTRYAHNSENIVTVGQLIKKDEQVAKIGSSGRSTGPHLHFEVFKNGRNVDPAAYIRRTNRS